MNIFKDKSLDDIYTQKRKEIVAEIERISDDDIASENIDAMVRAIVEKHEETCPEVLKDDVYVTQPDTERYNEDVHFTLFIPFKGEGKIFGWHDRSSPVDARVHSIEGNELSVRFSVRRERLDRAQGQIDERLAFIETYLGSLRNAIPRYNDSLKGPAKNALDKRKHELQKRKRFDKELAGIKIPIRKRETKAVESIIPVTRKMVTPKPTPPAAVKNVAIEQQTYDDILRSMESMVRVMERTPTTFSGMGEESLRDILLVNLNGIYEGAATGETFNGAGKTDILLRWENENVFIAECLVWDGKKGLLGKLDDQLFQYATWRDCKLAVIVFNKNKDFTAVINAMKETLSSHPQCIKPLPYEHTSGARYLFRRKDDPQREFQLTCLAFDVPKKS